jgi:hypothetical protein
MHGFVEGIPGISGEREESRKSGDLRVEIMLDTNSLLCYFKTKRLAHYEAYSENKCD